MASFLLMSRFSFLIEHSFSVLMMFILFLAVGFLMSDTDGTEFGGRSSCTVLFFFHLWCICFYSKGVICPISWLVLPPSVLSKSSRLVANKTLGTLCRLYTKPCTWSLHLLHEGFDWIDMNRVQDEIDWKTMVEVRPCVRAQNLAVVDLFVHRNWKSAMMVMPESAADNQGRRAGGGRFFC